MNLVGNEEESGSKFPPVGYWKFEGWKKMIEDSIIRFCLQVLVSQLFLSASVLLKVKMYWRCSN